MKFLVDESTGIQIAQFLKDIGYDADYPAKNIRRFSDLEVLTRAKKEKRIIITNDKDFGDYIFYQKLNTYGIILLRLQDESVENKLKVLKTLLTKFPKKLKGNFVTVTEERIRIRKI